jgi:signal transduction histidine kinase
MSRQPHDGPAESRLSLSMLPVVTSQERLAGLRRILSGFSHHCRNSLNGIKMSLYLVQRESRGAIPSAWEELEQTYLQLERIFDRLQAIYRPMPLTLVRSPLGPFLADHEPKWRAWFEASGRTLRVARPSQDLPVDFDPIHLGMGLDAVLAWRAEIRQSSRQPGLSWQTDEGSCELVWDEHEPLPSCVGRAGSAGAEEKDLGSARVDPLALPLLARIVAAHGGQIETTRAPGRGFGLTARWPRFHAL